MMSTLNKIQLKSIKDKYPNSSKNIVPGDDTPNIVLPILSIILVLTFIAIILWLIFRNPKPDFVNSNGQILESCDPGQCVTNIYTGIKSCPDSNSGVLLYNPVFQTCNSKFTCESDITPFAVQSDQSTNISGICPEGVTCRCVRNPQCATEITTVFQVSNGNPYQSVNGNTTTFDQVYGFIDSSGDVVNEQPIIIPVDQTTSTFCTISNEWLPRIWPKECVRGTLAYYPSDPASFDLNKANISPLACVIGEPCNNPTETAVWDNRVGEVFCYELCPQPGCTDGTQPNCQVATWNPSLGQVVCQNINS